MTIRDYRAIPVEVLRDFALTQTHVTSIRAVAEEVQVGRSTLHKFILRRTSPQPRVLRLLALWYLRKQGEALDADVARPYSAALSILVSDVPAHEQDAAREEAAQALRPIYERRNLPPPRWLGLLLNLSAPGR